MNSDVSEDYPAISKALGLLRARLFAPAPTTDAVLAENSSVSESPSFRGVESAEYKPDREEQPDDDDITSHQNHSSVTDSGTDLKKLTLEIAHDRFAELRSNPRQQRPVQFKILPIPPVVISKLLSFYQHHLILKHLQAWKVSTTRKSETVSVHIARLLRLQDSYEFWSAALPDATRIGCIHRLGKMKLAELHDKYRMERRVLVRWLQYTLRNRNFLHPC